MPEASMSKTTRNQPNSNPGVLLGNLFYSNDNLKNLQQDPNESKASGGVMKSVYDMRMSSQSNLDKAGKPPT